ncbi:hypothetical protein [Vibrio phage V-YDF132]|nr:hypothetical protein [Vibrio phage V-YDF132]
MALVLKRKKPSPSVATDNPPRKVDLVAPTDEPSHKLEMSGVPCHLHLAWNNDSVCRYNVWCNGVWIGSIETAGGIHVACKAHVPKDYSDTMSKSRITPTGATMMDGCYLLLKHAGVLPKTPNAKPKVVLDLSAYNIPF